MAVSNGKYYPETRAGNVFIGSTAAAGVAMPISTGTAVTFGLWNNSTTYNAVLMQLSVGFTSGTLVASTIGLANQAVGTQVSSGAAVTAATFGTPKNALLGWGQASRMNFVPATLTLATGGTACWWSGSSIETASGGNGIWNCNIDINGSIIVPPQQLVFACCSIAQTALFSMSLMWAEVPM